MLALEGDRLADAENLLQRAVSLSNPSSILSASRYADVRQKKFSAAIETLDRALSSDPSDAIALFDIGIAYEGIGDIDKSIAAFRKAADINPSYVNAHYNLGTLLMRMGRYHEAIESLNRAILLNPQFSDAIYNIAAAYAQLGDKRNAVISLKNAIELNPRLAGEALKDEDFRKIWSEADLRRSAAVVHSSEKSTKNR